MFATPNVDKEYENEYENMWISEFYCSVEPNKWGIWEGLREVLQNQFDGIVKKIKDKTKIHVIPKSDYVYNGIKYQFEFEFKSYDTNDTKVYGSIKYDRLNNRCLIIQNLGKLDKADLLMGGRGEKSNGDNKEIIGRHGEGMKLGAMAFVRGDEKANIEGKNFRIYTNGEKWEFQLAEDIRFPLGDNKYIKCLKVNIDNKNNLYPKDKITVEISPIDLENEWIKYIDRILWLVKWQKDEKLNLCAIQAKDEQGKTFGEIFLSEKFKNKIYVKDIFVQEFKANEDRSVACFFGFNTDLDLDRDRNAIKDLDKRNILFSKILSNILKRRLDISKNIKDSITYNRFKDYLKDIVYLIEHDYIMIRHILDEGNLGIKERDDIWDFLEEYKFKEADYGKIKKKQMLYSPYIGNLNDFLNQKKLPKEFYPYHQIDCWLTWDVLTKCQRSSYYKDYKTLYNEKVRNAKKVDVEPLVLKNIMDKIAEKLSHCHSNFKREYIKYKKFDFEFENYDTNNDPRDKIVDFENNIIYFSESLQNSINNTETKNWIFKMIVDKYNIDLFDLCKI